MMKPTRYALLVFLLTQSWFPPTGGVDAASLSSTQRTGENQMTNDDNKGGTGKTKPGQPGGSDTINTPAGPVPKEQVHEVEPGEAVRRNKDGTLTKVPRPN